MNESFDIKCFINWLMQLSPLEFTTLAVFTGYIISCNLTVNEQNSIGNWFELLGQIILTFNAQGSLSQFSITKDQYNDIIKQINDLNNKLNSNNW